MAEANTETWGLFPRLIVIVGAAMVVALAARPYQARIRPFLNEIKKVQFDTPQLAPKDMPAKNVVKESHETAREKKQRDTITEGDRSELQAVLKHL